MKPFRSALRLLLPLAAAGCFILFPRQTSAAVVEGLQLSVRALIPALFPFFLCIGLAAELGVSERLARCAAPLTAHLFHIGGAGSAALLFGLLGGYPAGAQCVASLCKKGQLSRDEGAYLLLFCNNAGPAFLFGVAAPLLGSSRAAALLWGILILSALLYGLLCRPSSVPAPAAQPAAEAPEFSAAFLRAVRGAGESMFSITVFVTAFSVFSNLLLLALRAALPPAAQALLTGTLELSGGLLALSALNLPLCWKLTAAAALCAFGGLCVFLQTKAVLQAAGLACTGYLRAKLTQALFAAALAFCAAPLLPPAQSAAALTSTHPFWLPAAFAAVFCLRCRKLRLDISPKMRYNGQKRKKEC